MSGRTLGLLARAERREHDRERQALAAIGAELVRVEAAIGQHEGRFGAEMALALTFEDGPRLVAAYAAGHRHRLATLRADRARLEALRAEAEAAARARALTLKTLELAADALAEREAEATARTEQKRLDDIAVTRHATRQTPARLREAVPPAGR